MKERLLVDEELVCIKGGQGNTNSNTVNYCICYYNNSSNATNVNGQPYCECKCIRNK
ncbi:hypothetical protein MASR2M12_07640 [Bacteroidales bacterium]|jgi:hypothetical protein